VTQRSAEHEVSALPVLTGGADARSVAPPTTRRRRYSTLSRRDKLILTLMVGIPTFFVVVFIVVPTILSIILSFSTWNGIGGVDRIRWVGLENYQKLVNYKQFWAASSTT
jgi:ABC-type sugar transport system permease subunit